MTTTVQNTPNKVKLEQEVDLGIKHHFSSGVYAKQMMLPKGHFVVGHAHTYDHLSILASGTVIVKTDEDKQVYFAPACITIQKHVNHLITAVEDAHWFCIHATTETDLDKVDEVLIMKEEA
jgi:quercetin dioxygenase-like cupin family protein